MIFLHSSFRVSSTWLWSRFRCHENVVAYYEIFNEELSVLTKAQINGLNPESWYSKHPPGQPYFLEFAPLIKADGGVDSYDRTMAFDRFIPAAGLGGALSEIERTYINRLIEHAETSRKIPLLSSTRSLGRLRAIKDACGGFHILVHRNLFHQWCSYTEQCLWAKPYFLETISMILDAIEQTPLRTYLKSHLRLDAPAVDSSDFLLCFVLLHLYFYTQMSDAADLVIDVNNVADDNVYRHAVEERVAQTSGIEIDLSDARSSTPFFAGVEYEDSLIARLRTLSAPIISNAPSRNAQIFASGVVDNFVEEFRRYGCSAQKDPPGALLSERHKAMAARHLSGAGQARRGNARGCIDGKDFHDGERAPALRARALPAATPLQTVKTFFRQGLARS